MSTGVHVYIHVRRMLYAHSVSQGFPIPRTRGRSKNIKITIHTRGRHVEHIATKPSIRISRQGDRRRQLRLAVCMSYFVAR